ncbi:hypothetical protein HBF26_05025 [Luteibacter jiangsuensis]|uniref:Uncharacterized protein n=1 Tax=Luteibacter jiangsuensis TaxID=637577 RepID=A0ABX0Q1L9_9GAMM|nr:hypothetical protein [Luteibacter jiangsuensis]NID04237.1 hypothetical protein [Luteibacter jiangsuensis]
MKRRNATWTPSSKFGGRRPSLWGATKPWLEGLSYVAQLAAVVLAWYGYVHTVLPVFQKERLEEEMARLQLDQEKATSELLELRGLQETADARLRSSLDAAKEAQTRANQAIIDRGREATKAARLREQNERYGKVIASAKENILRLQWQQFIQQVGMSIAFSSENAFTYYWMMPYLRDAPADPPEWPDSFARSMASIDRIAADYPEENRSILSAKAKAYVRQHAGEIECPAPPGFVKHVVKERDEMLSAAAKVCETKLSGFGTGLMGLKFESAEP